MKQTQTEATIEQKIEALKAEFSSIANWEERYALLIQKGKNAPVLPEHFRTEKNLIKGCQSQVWLVAELSPEGKVILQGQSDALLVAGLVSLLISVYSNQRPSDILQTQPDFIGQMGFQSHLSPSRANGFQAMLKQIYLYAQAFQMLSSGKLV